LNIIGFFARGEGLFVEGFEVDGAEGTDVRGELAVPVDEGALGDMETGGDAREAEAVWHAVRRTGL
jgi:hypothetical protein